MAKKYYSGQGRVSITTPNKGGVGNNGYVFMGNCSKLMIGTEIETVSHYESQTGQNYEDDQFKKQSRVTLEATFDEIQPVTLNRILYGNTVGNAVRTFTDSKITARFGKDVALARTPDLSQDFVLKDENAAVAGGDQNNVVYTKGIHYEISNTGMLTLDVIGIEDERTPKTDGVVDDSGIGNADFIYHNQKLLLDYTAKSETVTSIMTNYSQDFTLRFDGLNRANDNAPVVIELYRCQFDPSQFDAINEEYSEFELSGNVLYNSTFADNTDFGGFGKIILVNE